MLMIKLLLLLTAERWSGGSQAGRLKNWPLMQATVAGAGAPAAAAADGYRPAEMAAGALEG